MAEAPSRVQQMIARRRRAARRRRLVLLLLILGGGLFTAIKRWTDAHEVFTVEVIRLAACPDHLRGQAAAVLQPLLNRTFFEVAGQAGELRERLARLPEVASATLVCRPPNAVEVRLTPRVPTLAVQAGRSWLSVDSGGVIVRAVSNPERGLPQVYGLQPGVT
ncbi:MAG: FtsQ-type POTRA domain-containing protein, partial [Armatimonadetes bacterium]|nr:FtsQ-type POTRA domain-containing protein [Armatimonadota bacterium]